MTPLEVAARAEAATAIIDYAQAHHRHVEEWGTCSPYIGDRCDVTAAYAHAARIARGTA